MGARRGDRAGAVGGSGGPGASRGVRLVGRPWVARVATVALWALVVTGALAGVADLVAAGVPPPGGDGAPAPDPGGAEGFAELYVAAYLQAGEGTEDTLRAFYPGEVSLRGVPPSSVYVARTVSLGARPVAAGYWSVTVGADVLEAVEGGYRPAGVRYFTVGIREARGGYVATALPSEVPPPVTVEAPALRAEAWGPPPDDRLAEAVGRFLDAFLAGQGELARYTAPGSGIRPVAPSPFVDTEVLGLGTDEPAAPGAPLLAQVRVEARDRQGVARVLDYSLEVAERAGRWEVVRVLGAAPLEEGSA